MNHRPAAHIFKLSTYTQKLVGYSSWWTFRSS